MVLCWGPNQQYSLSANTAYSTSQAEKQAARWQKMSATRPLQALHPCPRSRGSCSEQYLSYLAATQGHEFLLSAERMRLPFPPEDADKDFKPEPTPFSFLCWKSACP